MKNKRFLWLPLVILALMTSHVVPQAQNSPSPDQGGSDASAEIFSMMREEMDSATGGSGGTGLAGVEIATLTYNPVIYCIPTPPGPPGCRVTEGVDEIMLLFINLTIPFYSIALMFTALFFIFKSGSPRARARSRSMFLKLIFGMIFVVASPMIYQFLLDLSSFMTEYVIHGSARSFNFGIFDLALPDSPMPTLADNINLLSHPLRYSPGVIASCIYGLVYLMSWIFASIIAWVRNIMVFVYGVFFPIIIFFYSFDPTKPWSRKWLNDAIKWIFVPVLQAMILVFTIAITKSFIDTVSYSSPIRNSMIFFAITSGHVLFAAAPLVAGQILGWIGNAVVAMGLGSGRTWMIAWGGIMSGQGHSAIAYAHSEFSRQRAYENMRMTQSGSGDAGGYVSGGRGSRGYMGSDGTSAGGGVIRGPGSSGGGGGQGQFGRPDHPPTRQVGGGVQGRGGVPGGRGAGKRSAGRGGRQAPGYGGSGGGSDGAGGAGGSGTSSRVASGAGRLSNDPLKMSPQELMGLGAVGAAPGNTSATAEGKDGGASFSVDQEMDGSGPQPASDGLGDRTGGEGDSDIYSEIRRGLDGDKGTSENIESQKVPASVQATGEGSDMGAPDKEYPGAGKYDENRRHDEKADDMSKYMQQDMEQPTPSPAGQTFNPDGSDVSSIEEKQGNPMEDSMTPYDMIKQEREKGKIAMATASGKGEKSPGFIGMAEASGGKSIAPSSKLSQDAKPASTQAGSAGGGGLTGALASQAAVQSSKKASPSQKADVGPAADGDGVKADVAPQSAGVKAKAGVGPQTDGDKAKADRFANKVKTDIKDQVAAEKSRDAQDTAQKQAALRHRGVKEKADAGKPTPKGPAEKKGDDGLAATRKQGEGEQQTARKASEGEHKAAASSGVSEQKSAAGESAQEHEAAGRESEAEQRDSRREKGWQASARKESEADYKDAGKLGGTEQGTARKASEAEHAAAGRESQADQRESRREKGFETSARKASEGEHQAAGKESSREHKAVRTGGESEHQAARKASESEHQAAGMESASETEGVRKGGESEQQTASKQGQSEHDEAGKTSEKETQEARKEGEKESRKKKK
ncbi:hypothetical protein ACFLRF_03680 [Candidatus Altiarchaeota archaeon]